MPIPSTEGDRLGLAQRDVVIFPGPAKHSYPAAMRFPQERFARTGIRPMSLMYPVRYPNPKTLVIGIADDEEGAASVGTAASIERT